LVLVSATVYWIKDMSFLPISPKTIKKPDRLQLVLDVYEVEVGNPASRRYEGRYQFAIVATDAQDGEAEVERRQGDAKPHLSAAQQAQIKELLDFALNKAQTVVP
jgi:hypothetical protein